MVSILNIIYNFEQQYLIRFLTSLLIIFLIWIVAPNISYFIGKLFNYKLSNSQIKKKPYYNPTLIYFRVLGIYLGFLFFSKLLNSNLGIIKIVKDIYFVFSTFIIARAFAKGFSKNSQSFKAISQKYPKLDSNMVFIILRVIRALIYLVALLIVLNHFKFDLSGLIAGLGIGGVVVSIAAQDAAKNIIAGFLLLIDKPFSVGDWISVNNSEGTVEEITFRSVRLRAFDNSLILIPNSILSDSSIINYSKMYQRRYKTTLVLELETPLDKVKEFCNQLKERLIKTPGVQEEGIVVNFDSINDNGIVINFIVFITNLEFQTFTQTKQSVNFVIMDVVESLGINLAYNSQTIYMQTKR